MSTSAQPAVAPPEVEATLSRLSSHKHVQGVLILSRPAGLILRSAGTLFALPPSAAVTRDNDDVREEGKSEDEGKVDGEKEVVRNSEMARRYAKAAVRIVESVGGEVDGLEGKETDDLRFLRIRTKKHELMITPDEQYILIVVQDPNH
ncbi:hypothetical protein JCM11641_005724 [Rhodosporidiobolus odoratus]